MLAPGGEATGQSRWDKLHVESLGMYPAFLAELTFESDLAIDFHVPGSREYPESEKDWPAMLARAERQRAIGIESIVEEGRLFYPGDAAVNPRDVVAALRRACSRRGVDFQENSPVSRLDDVKANWVVLAAGAWSSLLLPQAPAAFPVKGHLIGYALEPGALEAIYRRGHHYILQRQSGYVIAGSTTEHVGFDRTVEPQVVERLHRESKRVIPFLPDWPLDAWIGFRPGSHGDPHVGRFEDTRVWLAYGHYRNGILDAPITARMTAEELSPLL